MARRDPPPAEADPAKAASRELARLLATAAGARAARALQRAGMLTPPPPGLALPAEAPAGGAPEPAAAASRPAGAGAPEAPAAAPPAPAAAGRWPRPISIWQPRGGGPDLTFVRPDPLPLGDHFAVRRELRPKRAPLPLRVCLFGESAAAGYLYAPHLTPAGVLEAQLRAAAGQDAVEVIDLARTNETLPSLVATLESAVQIQPDVLVIFAGNNWNLLETPEHSPYAPAVAARQCYAAAWRHGGPAGPIAAAAGRLRTLAEWAFDRIAQVARALGVPVVLVVPEVSLAGWETRQPISWWAPPSPAAAGRNRIATWYRLLARARRHLARGAWQRAAAAAAAMGELDGGATPTAWRLLAAARRGAGDEASAAAAARAEIDAAAYPALAFLAAPQANSLTHQLLREAQRRHGFAGVDLPRIFAAHTGSPLPDQRLFLDYCHLTSEGMHVAMAAVASQVLHLAGLSAAEPDWRSLLASLPPLTVPPPVEAVARFGAAMHGAHRLLTAGPKAPLLEAWCDRALAADPGVASAMLDVLAARAAPLPAVLTPAQRHNLRSGFTLGLPHGWRWEHADADLAAAIQASLARHAALDGGAAGAATARAAAQAEAECIAHRAPLAAAVDLLDPPYYLWEPLERFFPDVMALDDQPRPATLRSPWPETSLCLPSDGPRQLTLAITARLAPDRAAHPSRPDAADRSDPADSADLADHGQRSRRGTARVSVNGVPAGSLRLTTAWSRGELGIPAHLLHRGLNRLTVHWPLPPPDGAAQALALDRLEQGIAADLHPVWGELYSLAARLS